MRKRRFAIKCARQHIEGGVEGEKTTWAGRRKREGAKMGGENVEERGKKKQEWAFKQVIPRRSAIEKTVEEKKGVGGGGGVGG